MDYDTSRRMDRQQVFQRVLGALQMTAGPGTTEEFFKVAELFVERVFSATANPKDYLNKYSLKMINILSLRNTHTRASRGNSMQSIRSAPFNAGPDVPMDWQPQSEAGSEANGDQLHGEVSSLEELFKQMSVQNILKEQRQSHLVELRRHLQEQQELLRLSLACQQNSSSNLEALEGREVIWPKLQKLKNKYLQDLAVMYGNLAIASLIIPTTKSELLQKAKHYKDDVLHRMFSYLTVPMGKLSREFTQDKLGTFINQIVTVVETFKFYSSRLA